jgi:hypothetical protein
MNLLCGSRVSARPFTARDARECRRRRGWQGDVRLIGLLGGKRQSKKRDRREGRGGARLARFLRRGHPAVLSPFAGACGRWRRQPGHPILRVSPRPIRSGRHHRFGFSASGSGCGLLGCSGSHRKSLRTGQRPQCPDCRGDCQQGWQKKRQPMTINDEG